MIISQDAYDTEIIKYSQYLRILPVKIIITIYNNIFYELTIAKGIFASTSTRPRGKSETDK